MKSIKNILTLLIVLFIASCSNKITVKDYNTKIIVSGCAKSKISIDDAREKAITKYDIGDNKNLKIPKIAMRDSVFSNDKDSIYFEVKIKDLGCDVKYHEIKEIEKGIHKFKFFLEIDPNYYIKQGIETIYYNYSEAFKTLEEEIKKYEEETESKDIYKRLYQDYKKEQKGMGFIRILTHPPLTNAEIILKDSYGKNIKTWYGMVDNDSIPVL